MKTVETKAYDPKQVETEISRFWEQGDYFHAEPDACDGRQPYTVVIPPPNVTGALHLGHAINNTLQDILVRWHRMRGDNTLWMPGTDHAGIATQAVVERRLKEQENKNRHDIGRDALVQRIWAWKDEYQARIIGQLKLMGCSCDWARTRFTLDDVCAKAVRHTFFRLFRDGLIYRGKRLVNWDPMLQTAVADDEVYHETVKGHLWHIRYPLTDGSGTVTVATTRPETLLGDTAVAVHPEDDRYKHLIGKACTLPLMDREIPIIADPILVKREFGSGCVKVTPAHDPNDYACAERNGLDKINILMPDGKINENGGRFAGLDRYEARKQVVAALEAGGQLERIEDYETDIGHSDRSKTPIEPYLSEQWFVRMSDLPADQAAKIEGLRGAPGLAQLAMDAVSSGRVKIHPERYAKSYLDWLGEKRDWCISRQLWWGHRIPIWYCLDCEAEKDNLIYSVRVPARVGPPDPGPIPLTPSRTTIAPTAWGSISADALPIAGPSADEDPTACPRCGGKNLKQDPDVLDTWFSSALWPHSTLGWPDGNEALDYYYPTSLLCTSRDIISLWVARMVLTGVYNTAEIPFRDVYIHTKLLDARGETMSKSKGNGVDPVDMIEAFGADALRFGMTALTTDTQDVRLPVEYRCPHCEHLTPQTRKNMSVQTLACEGCKEEFATQWADAATAEKLGRALCVSDKFEVARNFCNKLFQAARFAFMNLDGTPSGTLDVKSLPIEDRWILSQTSQIAATVNQALGRYQFSRTINVLRDYFRGSLCDWYLELIKSRIRDDNRADEARQVLAFCLDVTLRLFHPILPFITEHLWRQLNELAPSRGIPGVAELPASEACVIASFPPAQGWPGLVDAQTDAVFADIADATRGVREVRVTRGVSPKQTVDVTIKAPAARGASLKNEAHVVERLAGVGTLTIDPDARRPANAAKVLSGELQIYVHDVIDDEAERARLGKEIEQVDKQIAGKEKKLANEGFTSRAPAEVVQAERGRLTDLQQKRETLTASVEELDR